MPTEHSMRVNFDYVIVGGGVMGVSSALALRKEFPNAEIIIFEGEETKTASKGICKIIRTPYIDREYVILAEKAKEMWETELPYRSFYRRTGWIQEVRGPYHPFHQGERLIGAEESRHMIGSQTTPKLDLEKELWLNEDIGVADAALALEAVALEAASRGVVRQKRNISKLLIENGVCHGVEFADGTSISAETTIVAAGPWTPAILEKSRIQLPQDSQDNFFQVTAISVATLPLTEDEYCKLKSMPILSTDQGIITPPITLYNLTYNRRSDASRCSTKNAPDH